MAQRCLQSRTVSSLLWPSSLQSAVPTAGPPFKALMDKINKSTVPDPQVSAMHTCASPHQVTSPAIIAPEPIPLLPVCSGRPAATTSPPLTACTARSITTAPTTGAHGRTRTGSSGRGTAPSQWWDCTTSLGALSTTAAHGGLVFGALDVTRTTQRSFPLLARPGPLLVHVAGSVTAARS